MSIENNFDWEDASEQKQGLLKLLEEQIYHSSMSDEEKEKCLHLLLESRNQSVGILLLGPTGSGKSSGGDLAAGADRQWEKQHHQRPVRQERRQSGDGI